MPTSTGSSKKAREFQKNIYFCFIDYAKAFDCVDHSKVWKILKEMGIPDHLTFLLMAGWHHRLDGHEFEQALGAGDGQGILVCYSPWGHKELDMTERVN